MKDYVTVKINSDDLFNMLMNRLDEYWKPSKEVRELYEKMYENYIDNGCFDGMELDINVIVDNDWVNYCHVIEEGEEDYNKILKLYHEGNYDISCDSSYSFIESVSNDESLILVRY